MSARGVDGHDARGLRDGSRGTFVVSVDAELGWGHHDLASPPPERLEHARTGWLRLLSLFEEFDLPATWAVVGHLYLESCDGFHRDHPAPAGWFAREHGEWADRSELRFGSALIDRIEAADQSHELGCHTFSHVEFSRASTPHDRAVAELLACERAAGRSFDSFVFPRNRLGNRAALAELGYRCYRGPGPNRPGRGTLAGRAGKLRDGLVGRAAPLVEPYVDAYGLVNVPASAYLFDFEGLARTAVELAVGDPVVRRVRRGLLAAAREPGLVHLWLHPNNLYLERHVARLRAVFDDVARLRDEGHLVVETMGDVASTVA